MLCALLMEVCKHIHAQGWDYFFTPSISLKARLYRLCCKTIGVQLETVPGLELSSAKYEHVAMQLMFCHIKEQKLYNTLSSQDQQLHSALQKVA